MLVIEAEAIIRADRAESLVNARAATSDTNHLRHEGSARALCGVHVTRNGGDGPDCQSCTSKLSTALHNPQANRRVEKADAISGVEAMLNAALIVWGDDDAGVRRALLDARGGIREALGEART